MKASSFKTELPCPQSYGKSDLPGIPAVKGDHSNISAPSLQLPRPKGLMHQPYTGKAGTRQGSRLPIIPLFSFQHRPGSCRNRLPFRSTALPFCVLLYFLYSFFSFHIMPYGGYT